MKSRWNRVSERISIQCSILVLFTIGSGKCEYEIIAYIFRHLESYTHILLFWTPQEISSMLLKLFKSVFTSMQLLANSATLDILTHVRASSWHVCSVDMSYRVIMTRFFFLSVAEKRDQCSVKLALNFKYFERLI